MVTWPPPGLEFFCTFVEKEIVTDEKAFDPLGVKNTSKWDSGASSPAESYNADSGPELPEEAITAGEDTKNILAESLGTPEIIGEAMGKAVDSAMIDRGLDPNTGLPSAPSLGTMPETGLTMGATTPKASGNLGERQIDIKTSGFIQYAESIHSTGEVLCFVRIDGTNIFTYDIDDITYQNEIQYNGSVGLKFAVDDFTRFTLGAQYGGNAQYGAQGQGFSNQGGGGSSTISVGFHAVF